MTTSTLSGILTILFSIFFVVYSQRVCPSQCSCGTDPASRMGIIDCSNRGLTSIPDLAHPTAGSYARIDLSNNQLTTLDVDQVFKLIRGANVDVLDFSSNMISSVSGTFDVTTGKDYKTLNLANNLFTTFPENVIPLIHHRNELILDFSNNRLTELSRHMFAGGNDSTLFGFQFLASNNMISQIHDEAFQGVTLVDVILDLRSNRLSSLSPTFQQPAGVREYRFSGNPWNCDCNLRWIINPAMAIINRTENDPPNCVKPAALKGLQVFGLKSNEFTCLPFQKGNLMRNIVNQDSFTLSCPASADPPNPEISWTIWLPCPSEDDPLELTFTSDEITLSNIVINPRAAFRCTASNNAGSVNFDLDIRVNGSPGIDPPSSPTVPGVVTESTMHSTITFSEDGSSTTMKVNDEEPKAGRPVAGIIILVILLLISWCVIGFLIYRIWQLKKDIGGKEKNPGKVDVFTNGNTNNVVPASVEHINRIQHNGWGEPPMIHTQSHGYQLYAEPEKSRPVPPAKPRVPFKPPPPPKPTSNPFQYNTQAQYDDPPLKFGLHNGGYDYNNRDSVI